MTTVTVDYMVELVRLVERQHQEIAHLRERVERLEQGQAEQKRLLRVQASRTDLAEYDR